MDEAIFYNRKLQMYNFKIKYIETMVLHFAHTGITFQAI